MSQFYELGIKLAAGTGNPYSGSGGGAGQFMNVMGRIGLGGPPKPPAAPAGGAAMPTPRMGQPQSPTPQPQSPTPQPQSPTPQAQPQAQSQPQQPYSPMGTGGGAALGLGTLPYTMAPWAKKIPGVGRLPGMGYFGKSWGRAGMIDPEHISHTYNRLTNPDGTPRYYVPESAAGSGLKAYSMAANPIASATINSGLELSDWARNGMPSREEITGTSDPNKSFDLSNKDSYMGTYGIEMGKTPLPTALRKAVGGVSMLPSGVKNVGHQLSHAQKQRNENPALKQRPNEDWFSWLARVSAPGAGR